MLTCIRLHMFTCLLKYIWSHGYMPSYVPKLSAKPKGGVGGIHVIMFTHPHTLTPTCTRTHICTCHLSTYVQYICSHAHVYIIYIHDHVFTGHTNTYASDHCTPVCMSSVHSFCMYTCPLAYICFTVHVLIYSCARWYICLYVHMSITTHMLTCSPAHMCHCSRTHMLMCPSVHMSVCTHVHMLMCSRVHNYTYAHVFTRTYVGMYTCSYTHMLTCT